MPAPIDIIHRRVRDIMGAPFARLPQDSQLGVAVKALVSAEAPVVVTDADQRPLGLLSHADIVRKVTWRLEPDSPVAAVMTSPVFVVASEDTAFAALSAMRRRGMELAPVVDGQGRLVGSLSRSEALASLGGPVIRLIDLYASHSGVGELVCLKAAQSEVAAELLAIDTPGPRIQSLLTELNAELHRRVLDATIAHLAENGWGRPPIPFALMVMGSAGRGENALAPDQDNGLILGDHAPDLAARVEAYFAALSDRFCRQLDAVGFALCKGGVMASNPKWRRTLSDWEHEVSSWVANRKPQQLLASDILFDFAHVWGEAALSTQLRAFVTEAVAANTRFVRDLYAIESDHTVALGWFGRLRPEADELDTRDALNLKLSGTLPLVEGVRLFALFAGISETGTLPRLARLAQLGVLSRDEHEGLTAAFTLITRLMLAQQVADARQGREASDFVAETDLSPRDRDELVAALRAIGSFRARLKSEFGTGPFG